MSARHDDEAQREPMLDVTSRSDERIRLIASCPEETKPALALELEALGVREMRPAFRAIELTVDRPLYYELHLRLRTASRVLRLLKTVPAHNAPML